jgi:glycosyltransferase involved in cell wall biosynthesis
MTRILRVGVSANVLFDPRTRDSLDGIGVYTRNLLARYSGLDDVLPVPVVYGRAAAAMAGATAIRLPRTLTMTGALPLGRGRYFPSAATLERSLDVFHATDYRIPRLERTPVCASLYDAVPLSHPEWGNPKLRAIKNFVLRRSAQWAESIVTLSHAMVPQLVEQYGIHENRIHVTWLGVDAVWYQRVPETAIEQLRAKYGLDAGYLLFVGTLQPRKNVHRLLQAYAGLPTSMRGDVQLVIAGKAGWGVGELVAELRAANAGGRVRWLDYVAQSDLPTLYQGARGFVFPSLYEGFGLPVLEAFASGTPVVTSDTSSLPEVAGNAALLVDPSDSDAIAAAMLRLIEDDALHAELRSRGIARAREFTWKDCADKTLAVLQSMV